MSAPGFSHIAILGMGQMGASLGLAFAKALPDTIRSGYDLSSSHAHTAKELGAIDHVCDTPQKAVAQADIIVFCMPLCSYGPVMQAISSHIKPGTIITDIGSVKQSAQDAIGQHLPQGVVFVPAHPIAGSEKSGPDCAKGTLFENKLFILTPEAGQETSAMVQQVAQLWQAIGARTELMPANVHDVVYAAMSHLPQLLAYGCQKVLLNHGARVTGDDESYARFVRIGRSDARMWCDVFLENSAAVLAYSRTAREVLSHIRDELVLGSAGQENPTLPPDNVLLNRLHKHIWPRMVASALIINAQLTEQQIDTPLRRYAVAGFLDTSGPASQPPEADFETVSQHAGLMIAMLSELLNEMLAIESLIEARNADALYEALAEYQRCGIALLAPVH